MNEKPRAFEPRRLLDALGAHAAAFATVALLASFGGAVVARLAVPNTQHARAVVRVVDQPHAVFARALDADVLERALHEAHSSASVGELRARSELGFSGQDRLRVQVSGADEAGDDSRRLADALATTYVALANEPREAELRERGQHDEQQRARADAELSRAQAAMSAALAREGLPELEHELEVARATLSELTRRAALAEPASVQRAAPPAATSARSAQALLSAQRALSRALAEGADAAQQAALRARIRQLQGSVSRPAVDTAPQVEALATARTRLAQLTASQARVAPLRELLATAQTRRDKLAATAPPQSARRSAVLQHAELSRVEPRALRWLVALLAPLIAVLALALFHVFSELRDARVREASELAHWLAAPVLTSSQWPQRAQALESLVDALVDPALEALGTTLFLPLSELERPLAATLVTQLNLRAQRHFRSPTGSRVTIAQDWQGELDSTRLRRAAAAADRVIWVVAADVHQGHELATRRTAIASSERVAGVLVDAEGRGARSVGDSAVFWRVPAATTPEPELPPTTVIVPSTRVPPHGPRRVTSKGLV